MSMIEHELTEDELRQQFERALQDALARGLPCPSDTGLGYDVEKAIADVALAFPEGHSKVDAAKAVFEESLV